MQRTLPALRDIYIPSAFRPRVSHLSCFVFDNKAQLFNREPRQYTRTNSRTFPFLTLPAAICQAPFFVSSRLHLNPRDRITSSRRPFPEFAQQSGAAAPQSKTLPRGPGYLMFPPGFGLRQCSGAFRQGVSPEWPLDKAQNFLGQAFAADDAGHVIKKGLP